MSRVLGLGGVFFRAQNAKALASWYETHLGVTELWSQQAGPTIFAPFQHDTDYFGRENQQFMLNFRVADLDAIVADLVIAGIPVETQDDWDSPEAGRFARIHDPEGNPIELWEPARPDGH